LALDHELSASLKTRNLGTLFTRAAFASPPASGRYRAESFAPAADAIETPRRFCASSMFQLGGPMKKARRTFQFAGL
jgi:hypothetical protein